MVSNYDIKYYTNGNMVFKVFFYSEYSCNGERNFVMFCDTVDKGYRISRASYENLRNLYGTSLINISKGEVDAYIMLMELSK
jgi:hypothetical protein